MLNPFDPRGLHSAVRVVTYTDVDQAGDKLSRLEQAVRIPADQSRVWIAVTRASPSTAVRCCPVPGPTTDGFGIEDGSTFLILHATALPGLVAGEWLVFWPMDGRCTIRGGTNYKASGGE